MSRIARKNLESNYLHIIVQGIEQTYIFKKDTFKKSYKSILKRNMSETNIKILAYCIMGNHMHILIYSEDVNEISKLMQRTNTSFAKLYNKINNRVGYVFRDRYYTQPITTEKQLFNCLAYIHNNPIKANLVEKLDKYKYSSYSEYLKDKDLITSDSIKLVFGNEKNYKEMFYKIHQRDNIEDIVDIHDSYKSAESIIKEFMNDKNMTIEEIRNNEKLFSELLMNLRHMGGISLRDMAKIFNSNKDKLRKIINKSIVI